MTAPSKTYSVAVIPARGGSKRIPRKNIKPFCGKPIIAWSIEAARESGCFDRILVSTDDDEIAKVATSCGAEVPFMRPGNLSDDFTGTTPVIAHAIDWLQANNLTLDLVCCIYATAPFVDADDLRTGRLLMADGVDYAFSVTSYAYPIQRALRLTDTGGVVMFDSKQFSARSQDLEQAYHDAGQFYWGTADAWQQRRPIFSENSKPIILPRHRVQDIDTFEDWERAQWLFQAMRTQSS